LIGVMTEVNAQVASYIMLPNERVCEVTARVEEAKQSYESAIQRDAKRICQKKVDGFVAECNRQGSEFG